jgi:hypothetical protein
MNLLALLSGLFEPISICVALAVVLVSRKPWIVPIAAAVSAVATEFAAIGPAFSYGFLFQAMASLVHATVIFWFRRAVFPR